MAASELETRTPSDYTPTGPHFIDMKRDRNIPGGAIRECIENGEVREHEEDNCIKLTAKYGAVYYTMTVDPEEREVVTIYREGY